MKLLDNYHRLRQELFAKCLVAAFRYKTIRSATCALIYRYEGGEMHSLTLRRILAQFYGVTVGLYSYGSLVKPGVAPRGTVIGRYSSIGPGVRVFRRNHPKDHLSLHPFFYLKSLGFSKSDLLPQVETNPLIIGNDVWLGANVVILPQCALIGDGAIVGAGSIVTKDVAPFSVVAGNPAKVISQRFSDETAAAVQESAWWNLSIGELASHISVFSGPVSMGDIAGLGKYSPR